MHIPDGLLSLPVIATGALGTAAALAWTLPKLDERMLPKVALVTAVFFVASLVSVPVGPTSAHLVLSTLLGLVLGPAAFPAVFVALLLQAVFFGFGGLTTLGVTTVTIALPGVLWATAARRLAAGRGAGAQAGIAAAAAFAAIYTSAGLVIAALAASDGRYLASAPFILATYLPLAAAEAAVTGAAVAFLSRVSPEALVPAGGRLA